MAGKEGPAGQIVLNPEIPGGVYLCQVSQSVSCGACCGLYNVTDLSRDSLHAMLTRRTRRFADVDSRNLDAVLSFRKWVEDSEPKDRPFADFHHCPYIGLIGSDLSRPGCLLHPLGNGGVDLRGISDYGGLACRSYFCPTHDRLSADIKILIQKTAGNWYTYGLLITEAALVQAVLDAAGHACGFRPDGQGGLDPAYGVGIIRNLMELKQSWPYRCDPDAGCIHYFFNDRLYARAPVDYRTIGAETSPYDRIFQELGSCFASIHELCNAEALIEKMLKCSAL